MKKRDVQLVIQFPEDAFPDLNAIVAFEGKLRACMPRTCEVDGYDAGAGTVNFFVYTSAPEAAHRTFRKYLGTRAIERRLRIAWREVDGESFTNLWPRRDPRPFDYAYPDGANPFAPGAKRGIPKRRPAARPSEAEPASRGRRALSVVPASPHSGVVAAGPPRSKRRARVVIPPARESAAVASARVRAERARAEAPPAPESAVVSVARAKSRGKGKAAPKGSVAKTRAAKATRKKRAPGSQAARP